jgi:hypothetical protein
LKLFLQLRTGQPDLRKENRSKRAFTLTQLIGVLAVMAILASVITPVAIKRLDQSARDAEAGSLASMAEAFVQTSLEARSIPGTNTMAQMIASYLSEQTNRVRVNKRGLLRVFLADPTVSINGMGLMYSQTSTGAAILPSGVRFIILSSVGRVLPAINPSDFDNIWTTPKGSVPSSFSSWGGRGEDLLMERIELGSKFHKILLMNVDRAPAAAIYSIDNSITNSVTAQSTFSAYFINGTILNIFRPDGTVDFRELIHEDFSLVYQNGRWGRELDAGSNDDGDFGQLVDRFLKGPAPCEPEVGANQRVVVNAFYDYLWGYADWAFGDTSATPAIPPFAGSGSSFTVQYPSYTVVNNAVTHLGSSASSFTANLIK